MSRPALRLLALLTSILSLLSVTFPSPAAPSDATQDVWASFIITLGDELHPLSAYRPAVYENKIVYVTHDYEKPLFYLVAVKDLNTGETRILANELPEGTSTVDISGDWIVSRHVTLFYHSVHAFNLATDEHLVIDPGIEFENYYPAIDGNHIIWVQVDGCCSSDILLYDLTTRSITPITDDDGANYEYETDISGDWVIWHQGIYPEWDIIAYSLVTSEKLALTDRPFLQMGARIDGNIVVWKDITIPGQDADIIGYDLNTRQTFPVAVGLAWQDQPFVHDGLITWVQIWGPVDHDQSWGQDVGGSDGLLGYDGSPPYNYERPTNNGGPVSYDNLVVWIESSGPPEYDLILRGARRLTQQTFLPLARR